MDRQEIISQLGGIKLKNIDLKGISVNEQSQKICEEEGEFIVALIKKDKENAIEEFWDIVQAHLGLLQVDLGITVEEVMEGYTKHLKKLKNRPRKKED